MSTTPMPTTFGKAMLMLAVTDEPTTFAALARLGVELATTRGQARFAARMLDRVVV